MKSIVDQCNGPVIMEFEGFIIRKFDGWHLWFEHPSGEGTTTRKTEFIGALMKLFEEKF